MTGRWHPDPDPHPDQAYRDRVDLLRRHAEEKAQAEFPEPVYVGDDGCI